MSRRRFLYVILYLREFVASAFRRGSLAIEVLGLLVGVAGLLYDIVPKKWVFFYFLLLTAITVLWNAYKVSSKLYQQLQRAESVELLIKSRAKVRALQKTRVVRIAERGAKDTLETHFVVEAISAPVKNFYCRFMTDCLDFVLDTREDWKIAEGRPVKTNMYKIGRKYAEFIVENELFSAIFPKQPKQINITQYADLVNPESDWVGVDIMEETHLAVLEIWFPVGWRPIPGTIERFVLKDEEEAPVPGEPDEIGYDETSGQWYIRNCYTNCELFVSNCIRWRAEREGTSPTPPSTLSTLEPKVTKAK